ncbi:MAG TPA: hypothetical protein VFU13_19350 [Steroidobacteraceae bacterium]|nr:hypothetical protein [Steroidobacteraceae bacterium]
MTSRAAPAGFPHLDAWALGILFFLSRVNWVVSQNYHGSANATGAIYVSLAASLMVVLAGYGLAALAGRRFAAVALRTAVLVMWLFVVAVTFRHLTSPTGLIDGFWQAFIAVAALAFAVLGAVTLAPVWRRLRAALLAAALISAISPFVLVAILAPRIELLADSGAHRRPVLVLLLDEFSAGAAHDAGVELGRMQLNVATWAVPSIGRNTIDVIPALFSGKALEEASTCTASAVCGRGTAVDFARMRVLRDDVDIAGFYHRYCDIRGLRSCVGSYQRVERSAPVAFLCALPPRRVFAMLLDCGQPMADVTQIDPVTEAGQVIDGAPFWDRGGIFYVHLLLPHLPSFSGELRLVDAYAANVERASRLIRHVVENFDRSPMRDDYTLIITSDHSLRVDYWCQRQPYASHDCEVPATMRTPDVPFIVASRGPPVSHRVPRSNLDLLPIVAEIAGPR